jgi:hypothetical protein
MTTRLQVFDHFGVAIGEINADAPRAWILSDAGKCSFKLSIKDAKASADLLQFGNFIAVEHDKLPTWAGILYTPRTWDNQTVEISARSGEFILQTRRVNQPIKLNLSAGDVFERILLEANKQGLTLANLGQQYSGGKATEFTISPAKLMDETKRLVEQSGEEYTFIPHIENNRLSFDANWYKKAGIEIDYLLSDGFGGNIESKDRPLVEQDDIVTDVLAYGNASTWDSKNTDILTDAEGLNAYGLFQGVVNVNQNGKAAITQGGVAELNRKKQPRRTFSVSALEPAFPYIGLGNTLSLSMQYAGFYGGGQGVVTKVRITGFGFDERDGKSSLILDEVIV